MTDVFYGPAPRATTIHFAGAIRDDGAVSALCYVRTRPIDLRVATWTNRIGAVTCAKCKALLAARREGGER